MVEIGAGLLLVFCGTAILAGAGAALGLDILPLVGTGGAASLVVIGMLVVASGFARRAIARNPGRQQDLRTARLTAMALAAVAVIGVILPLTAETANLLRVSGLPLGYYIAAQGAPIGLVVLAFAWAARQHRIDGSAPEPDRGGERRDE